MITVTFLLAHVVHNIWLYVLQNYGNDMTEKAVRICRAYLPGAWKKITATDVEVKRIRYVTNLSSFG